MNFLRLLPVLLLVAAGFLPGNAMAQRALSNGQHLYLPIYAFVQYGDLDRSGAAQQLPVSALVSIHNTDLDKPMETLEFLVERRDVVGGSGANFVS
jgi:hypothetical protein